MKTVGDFLVSLTSVSLIVVANAAGAVAWTCDDSGGALGHTIAPVHVTTKLTKRHLAAARAGRLGMVESVKPAPSPAIVPVQWQSDSSASEVHGICLLPPGSEARRRFVWREHPSAFPAVMQAVSNAVSGQIEFTEAGKPVLRYNYRTVGPGAVLEKIAPGNRIYARARSDYVHPLYGPSGELLTQDWPVDHPHHRGIYWAWPEVDFGDERGDLHALQRVFARPTGHVRLQSGPVSAEVTAENQWLWEDREPIVREVVVIRAYRATAQGRVVDLAFQFTALKDGVTLARRGTDKYGGLNVRLGTPKEQIIAVFTGDSNAVPRRAWSDVSGSFAGSDTVAGLMILQHTQNANYPGDWVQYPEISWCQPTFPSSGKRFALQQGRSLVLRYRLWIHAGTKPEEDLAAKLWEAFHSPAAALPLFELPNSEIAK